MTKAEVVCVAVGCIVPVFLFAAVAIAGAIVTVVYRHPPQFEVVGARLDKVLYSYVSGDAPGLHIDRVNVSVTLALDNRTPSAVVFRDVALQVKIANTSIGIIKAQGPFHVGAYSVELGAPGIAATDVHHVFGPFMFSGEARTDRKLVKLIPDHQSPKLNCLVDFNFRSGEPIIPFACKSKTPYEF